MRDWGWHGQLFAGFSNTSKSFLDTIALIIRDPGEAFYTFIENDPITWYLTDYRAWSYNLAYSICTGDTDEIAYAAGEVLASGAIAFVLSQFGKGSKAKPDKAPKYPGNNPNISPGKGWEWRGSGNPSSGNGSWYNPKTGASLHPDLSHALPIGPHYDYIPYKGGPTYRLMPDGSLIPK
ncbi:MAG: polymorphic toxin type 37 domain-containing protein [Oscillospiraceae bacterium]|nr:polymorphic toxin type 37 domain-containing protein [Oscillospiraceae bacterium]